MSYNPESSGNTEPSGGNETRNMGNPGNTGNPEQPGGQPTMPSGGAPYTPPTGGYTPPPQQGGYVPPQGGYAPPPPPQGGYVPPQQGGYVPPQGGYAPPPPPQGGYAPPPQGGGYGYGAPPPPQPPPGNFKFDMNQITKTDYQNLFQKYINALTKPNVATYDAEIPQANWSTIIISVVIVTVVSIVINILTSLLFAGQVNAALSDLQRQFGGTSGSNFSTFANLSGASIGGAFLGIIFTPAAFFLGAGILWLTARMFGGTGSNFMTHCYLLALSYTPTRVIAAVIGFIPGIGFIGGLLYLYQLYLAGLALQSSQRMQSGRAQLAAWLPALVGVVLFCLGIVVCAGLFASALNR